MVKIAIAGGSGGAFGPLTQSFQTNASIGVGSEVVDALVATNKHEVILLSRKDAQAGSVPDGTTWVKADYASVDKLAEILQGVHTVLSFVTEEDPTSPVQKNLIDAAVRAGVKRFAPSEWVSSGTDHMAWYGFKKTTRQYLRDLNKDGKVLEYSLFQPGYFTNYLTRPYKSTKHIPMIDLPWDFQNRRWLAVEGGENSLLTLTTVQDFCNVVVRAIDFKGEWPVIGGIRGGDITAREFLALAEKVRGGKPFAVETVTAKEFESGEWKTSWYPLVEHNSIPVEKRAELARFFTAGIILAVHDNQLHVSDDWNQLLPDYKFTSAEEFLSEAWSGKP